ncbi:MAG: CDP-glycerol glycerophosphotransferase family protein [Saprospiraceae bacterium]
MSRILTILKKVVSLFIKYDRYDVGFSYESSSSFADTLMRHFYARLHQKERFEIRKLVVRQYRGSPILFHLRRAIRKLKLGKIPIRIVFIAQEPRIWRVMDSLYRACKSDSLFKVYVVNSEYFWQFKEDCSTFLKQNNIEYLDGLDKDFRFDLLNPDIIVLGSPYDEYRPEQHSTANLLRFAELIYIPYGIDFSDGTRHLDIVIFGDVLQKNAWRIFTRSKKSVGNYIKHGGISSKRVVSLGLPVLDQYYSSTSSGVLPEAVQLASAGKFKIIYSPHHSLTGWSTFLLHSENIRQLVQENQDCYLVCRPHPGLMEKLKNENLMSQDAFRSMFVDDRCYLYEGDDYYGLFRWSDMLISDASSFLGEYAPSQNPIIYLHRDDGWELDESIRDDFFNSCYVARSKDEVTTFFEQLKNGVDPKKSERKRYQENISEGIFTGGAGQRIANYLREKLA